MKEQALKQIKTGDETILVLPNGEEVGRFKEGDGVLKVYRSDDVQSPEQAAISEIHAFLQTKYPDFKPSKGVGISGNNKD